MAGEADARAPVRLVFTALELAAAEHLIRLSGSSSVGSTASASSSSPRSVNNAPAAPAGQLAAAEDDDGEQEVGGRRRRNKRYRPVAEIYAATEPKHKLKPKPIGPDGGKEKRRPSKPPTGKEARTR
jgi:hypothetical protein